MEKKSAGAEACPVRRICSFLPYSALIVDIDGKVKELRTVLIRFEVDFILACQPSDGGVQVSVRQSRGFFQVFVAPTLPIVQQFPDDAGVVCIYP